MKLLLWRKKEQQEEEQQGKVYFDCPVLVTPTNYQYETFHYVLKLPWRRFAVVYAVHLLF